MYMWVWMGICVDGHMCAVAVLLLVCVAQGQNMLSAWESMLQQAQIPTKTKSANQV